MALNFLFIHGAWHGAANWTEISADLVRAGHRVMTVDLPAHGPDAPSFLGYPTADPAILASALSPAADITIDQAADIVIDAISRGPAHPIVVAHSLGGPIVTAAAERVPDQIGRLVYIAGHVTHSGWSAADFAALPGSSTGYGDTLFVADPAAVGAIRINPKGDASYMAQLREAYYQDVPQDIFDLHASRMVPDLPVAFWVQGVDATAGGWGRVPRSYIRCTLDRALAPAIQTRMIEDADALTPDNRFRVLDLASGHSPFASMPEELVKALIRAA